MQQVQEKQQVKISAKVEQPQAFKQSAIPTVLAVASKTCYGISGASLLVSAAIWNAKSLRSLRAPKLSLPQIRKQQRKAISLPTTKNVVKAVKSVNVANIANIAKIVKPSNKQQQQDSRRRSAIVAVCAPTFALAGKVLSDASDRMVKHEFAQWEQQQADTARSQDFRARFFNR